VDHNARVLIWVLPSLGRHGVLLIAHRFSDVDVAALEHGYCITENEVDGAVNVTVTVELALRVDVECILIALEATPVEG